MPPVGSPSQVLPAARRMIPSQNVGVAQAISENVRAPTSRGVFRFQPSEQAEHYPQDDGEELTEADQHERIPELGKENIPDGLALGPGDAEIAVRPLSHGIEELIREDRFVEAKLDAQRLLDLGEMRTLRPITARTGSPGRMRKSTKLITSTISTVTNANPSLRMR